MPTRRQLIAAICASLLLAGCATPPRSSDNDTGIRSVAVVTVLRENVPLRRIGLTVFNNQAAELRFNGELNPFVRSLAEDRLKQARPAWLVKPSGTDASTLMAQVLKVWDSWGSKFTPLEGAWAAVAQRADVDALVIVEEAWRENGSGMAVEVRALPGLDPRAMIRLGVNVSVVDRQGKLLVSRGLMGSPLVPASQLGLTDQLASAADPATTQKLQAAVKEELARALPEALGRMGY